MPNFKEVANNVRQVPIKMLLKGTTIIVLAPFMILTIFTLYGKLDVFDALLAASAIFIISVIFVRPYIANLSSLTNYVEQLALDKKAQPPDLSFLNNVEELSQAVERLQKSWENRKSQLEGYLGESKLLIDSLPNILILLDKKLNVVQTNNTAQSTFRKNGIQATLDYIIKNSEIYATAKDVLNSGEGKSLEFSLPDPIAGDYMIRIEKFPVFSPRGIALILVMHDITELKRTEQTFADFVANASHEIRTPLTSLIGFIETLKTSAKNDKKAREKFLGLMEEQADRMAKLVKDLLSLSQIERKMTTRPTEKVNIRNMVKETVKQILWHAEEKDMNIKQKFGKNIPDIIGDTDELSVVTYNLIINAIKYGKEGGDIEVSVQAGPYTNPDNNIFKKNEAVVSIAVTDQGEGISAEHLPRLTERFYRVDKARSRKIGGTGLGLSIVKHILDRHQGTMTIESEVGKGSTFTVWLPVNN